MLPGVHPALPHAAATCHASACHLCHTTCVIPRAHLTCLPCHSSAHAGVLLRMPGTAVHPALPNASPPMPMRCSPYPCRDPFCSSPWKECGAAAWRACSAMQTRGSSCAGQHGEWVPAGSCRQQRSARCQSVNGVQPPLLPAPQQPLLRLLRPASAAAKGRWTSQRHSTTCTRGCAPRTAT